MNYEFNRKYTPYDLILEIDQKFLTTVLSPL